MIVAIDPAFFVGRHTAADVSHLARDMQRLVAFIKETGGSLVRADYWVPMWDQLIHPLERAHPQPQLRRELQELRRRSTTRSLPGPLPKNHVWGFKDMFGAQALGTDWSGLMETTLTRLILTGEKVVVFTRRVEGRNWTTHAAGDSTITEHTQWRLYVQPRTTNPLAIQCVAEPRHVKIAWTARYDARLPGVEDGARYPFCPPDRWWKRRTVAVRTHTGKPAFIDADQCGWARPNITGGTGYHWDVFLSSARSSRVGINQVNVVASDAPISEGVPGTIHHVPQAKVHAFHDSGWSC